MKIVKTNEPNTYAIEDLTAGKLMALWSGLEERRKQDKLSAVEYDCWVQLNRFVEEYIPKAVEISV